jgi:hypothetical protein
MSLDIYGTMPVQTHQCPNCGHCEIGTYETIFEHNITHNLRDMARESGCGILWDMDYDTKAGALIAPLTEAIQNLQNHPEKFNVFSASNGWGTREQFIPWLQKLLVDCIAFPHATLNISK